MCSSICTLLSPVDDFNHPFACIEVSTSVLGFVSPKARLCQHPPTAPSLYPVIPRDRAAPTKSEVWMIVEPVKKQ